MAKSTNDVVSIFGNTQPVAFLEIGEAEKALAAYLEVDLKVQPDGLLARCKEDAQVGVKASLRIGLRLMALKAQCGHGEFEAHLQDSGIGLRDGQNCMQLASAYAAEGDARRRDALLEMGKTKAVMLLAAKPAVREQVFESAELLTDLLESSKRDFEAQLKKLKDENARLQNENQASASKQFVQEQGHIISPLIPFQISDVRRETAALYKQAALAIAALADVPAVLLGLQDVPKAGPWMEPTATQIYTAMQSLHATLATQMATLRDAFALDGVAGLPAITDTAYYQPEEAVLVATHFEALTTAHLAAGQKRAKVRANEAPGKLGRKLKVD